tara:strand:+ start:21222 stop:21833 length:612 start_codon:yes stop_codon:yes gene_type:complete
MGKINWKTQEVIINPKLLDMIPKLNSWLPPKFIDEILRDVQVWLEFKEEWFSMQEFESIVFFEMKDNLGSDFYLKNTKTTAFDLTLFCCAWKRNPETVFKEDVQKWAKKVSLLFNFEPVWEDTHSGLAEIDDVMIINAIYEFNNPKTRLYRAFIRGSILSYIPKGFFILPIQQYPFMNFWETPFPEKKKVKKDDWDDISSLFK